MIDATAWKSARPAARRVRRQARVVTTVVGLVAVVAALAVGSLLLLVAVPVLAWAAGRGARHVLARRAVGQLRGPALRLPVVPLADLVALGSVVHRGVRLVAVEDEASVTVTSTPSGGRTELPVAAVTSLGEGV